MQPVRFNVVGMPRAFAGRLTQSEKLEEVIGEHLRDFAPGAASHTSFDRVVFMDGVVKAVIRRTASGACEVTRF